MRWNLRAPAAMCGRAVRGREEGIQHGERNDKEGLHTLPVVFFQDERQAVLREDVAL
jgi:hypothetical protein